MLTKHTDLRTALFCCAVFAALACGARAQSTAHDGAQKAGGAFVPGMSLAETMDWLGRRMTAQRSDAVGGDKAVWHRETRAVRAKGCALSFWSVTQTDGGGVSFDSAGYQTRELWVLDLAGLDPARVSAHPQGQVWFWSDGRTRDAIRRSTFGRDERLQSVSGNRAMGHFWARDAAAAEQLAAALRHAVGLCRQQKP